MILRPLVLLLEVAGYEVETAPHGLAGLTKFRHEPWDAVVTDLTMPVLDGAAMTTAIKTLSPAMPVILMTGVPSEVEDPSLFLEVLGKPFPFERLLKLLENACRIPSPAAAA